MITVTANDHNVLFIHADGKLVADSMTIRRVRGFHNKVTGEWAEAKDFTPRKVKASPGLVLGYLATTGLDMGENLNNVTVAF